MSQLRIEEPRSEILRGHRAGARRLPVVVFDLDGTLVDTAPDLTASLNHCLARAGLPPLDVAAVRPHAGKGVRVMLQHAYAQSGLVLSPAQMEEQAACFLTYYELHIADHSVVFAGAEAAMDRLSTAGYALAICTNKLERLSRLLLEALGLASRFAAICGADTFRRRKPDPVHLLGTVERAGGEAARAVMVGDTDVDMDAAFAASIPSILVDFGYGPDEQARRAADRIVTSFDEIDARMIEALVEARRVSG